MTNETLLLGVDGGGSKTVALLARADDVHILGRGVAGSSNYQRLGETAAQAALAQAIQGAFADARREPCPPAAACFGLAGVDRPEERAAFENWSAGRWPGGPVMVANDAELVLSAGTPHGWGVAVICGTGAIVFARDHSGRTVRANGWGYLLGDEGSGYWIGLSALRSIMQAVDGRGPHTSLTAQILGHWGLQKPESLVRHVYREDVTPADIAALAGLVEQAASQGDAVALDIATSAGNELAKALAAAVSRLALQSPLPCALAGGVVTRGHAVRAAFLSAAARAGTQLSPFEVVREPAQGALRLARTLLCRQ